MFDELTGLESQVTARGQAAVEAALATASGPTATGDPDQAAGTGALVEVIESCERASRAISAAQLACIARFETAQRAADKAIGVGSRLSGRTVPIDVGLTLGISTAAGSGRVVFACSLVSEHPALLRLLADGLVSEWHLRLVVTATEQLTPEEKTMVARQLAVDVRARAKRKVKELTPHQLGQAAARLAIAIDPDAATARFEKARRQREVSVLHRHDGAAALWVKGPAEQTQHMYDEVERDAVTRRHDGDPRSLNDIMFEQLYETVIGFRPAPGLEPSPGNADAETSSDEGPATAGTGGGGTSAEPNLAPGDLDADDPAHDTYCDEGAPVPEPVCRSLQHRQHRVEAQIVMSSATLLGLNEHPALLRGYGAIPAEIARRIADTSCDDTPSRVLVRRLFCDPLDGRLVQMDSKARLFKGPLREFALFRDHSCRLSGGRIRDIDHISPHHSAGLTSAANGQALAKNSHVLRDHPRVHVSAKPYRPDGFPPADDPDGSHTERFLDKLRGNAPNVEWTLPSGRIHRSEPPPALGHGSTAPLSTSVMELELELMIQRAQRAD